MKNKDIKQTEVHNEMISAPEQYKDIKKKRKKGAGRPSVMTESVLAKLEQAFAYDMPDEEACHYAGISPDALYDYQTKNPKFTERKHALKNRPVMLAREAIVKSLSRQKIKTLDRNGNLVEIDVLPDNADVKWYLERKKKGEFASKTTVEHEGTIEVEGAKELADAIQQLINEPEEDYTLEEDQGDENPSS